MLFRSLDASGPAGAGFRCDAVGPALDPLDQGIVDRPRGGRKRENPYSPGGPAPKARERPQRFGRNAFPTMAASKYPASPVSAYR